MLASRRWRDWTPPEKTETRLEHELTKPPKTVSVSFVSTDLGDSERNTGSEGMPPHDPAEWRKPFARWLDSACVRDPRCFGGVTCLHIAFCEWAIAHDDVPCTRVTFERLLRELEFLISDGMVSGLTFLEDFESAGLRRE
jgi:hypothetical protein